MKIYLKFINPIVAIIVLLLCLLAAISIDGKCDVSHIIAGGFTTYFLAKGLFCSSALFIIGKILESMIVHKRKDQNL